MDHFLLLLKSKQELDYSPEKLQQRLEEYREWISTIHEHYISDNRLERSGSHILSKDNVQTDGPFLEAKEIISGYVIISAEDLKHATIIAKSSPLLKYFEIMVRPIVMRDPS